ncbi:MAG: glycosyltransferase [Cyclobacteriaceae bacterium]|nr:glycosyltransferase [Cyclobacteriaceae bacterium]
MKVLHVIDSLMVGGAERVLVDQSNLLSKNGYEISVLVLSNKYPLRRALLPEISFYSIKSKFSLRGIDKVWRLCRNHSLVHVHMRYNFRYIALIKLLTFSSFKIVHQDHYGDIDIFKQVPFLIRFFSKLNPWYIGVSIGLTDWAYQQLHLRKESILLLPNIVLIQKTPETRIDKQGLIKVLMVANFREAKNHTFLIGMVPAFLEKFTCVEIHFYGKVLNTVFFDKLLAEVKALNLEQTIYFHTDCDNIQPVLKSFDAAIHPAKRESGPLVLIEYLGHSVPFLAYTTGQVAEQLAPELPELFVNSFEPSVWLERFSFILNNKEALKYRMEKSFDNTFSEESYVLKLINFYSKVYNSN